MDLVADRTRRTRGASRVAKDALKALLPREAIRVLWRVKARAQAAIQRWQLIQIPTFPEFLDVLYDEAFQRSVREIKSITLYDTPRLANLWQLCQMSDPDGNILEAGVFRGGSAVHLMNCRPNASFIVADTLLVLTRKR